MRESVHPLSRTLDNAPYVNGRVRPSKALYSGRGQAAIHDDGSLGDYGPVREEVAGENEPQDDPHRAHPDQARPQEEVAALATDARMRASMSGVALSGRVGPQEQCSRIVVMATWVAIQGVGRTGLESPRVAALQRLAGR